MKKGYKRSEILRYMIWATECMQSKSKMMPNNLILRVNSIPLTMASGKRQTNAEFVGSSERMNHGWKRSIDSRNIFP